MAGLATLPTGLVLVWVLALVLLGRWQTGRALLTLVLLLLLLLILLATLLVPTRTSFGVRRWRRLNSRGGAKTFLYLQAQG